MSNRPDDVPRQGDPDDAEVAPQGAPEPREDRSDTLRRWRRRILVGGALLIALIILWFLAASFVPRWWAQRVGGLVEGAFSAGVAWGLFFGFLFTFVPVLIAGLALRRGFGWRGKLGIIAVALVLAIPNLMTLGVVLGRGNGAHAGERIFDVEGPAFRGASLVGALIAAVAALGIVIVLGLLRRRGRELKTLRAEDRRAP